MSAESAALGWVARGSRRPAGSSDHFKKATKGMPDRSEFHLAETRTGRHVIMMHYGNGDMEKSLLEHSRLRILP